MQSYTYAQLASVFSFGLDLEDDLRGPYSLTPHSGGVPEGGNFNGGIIFGDGETVMIDSWGGSPKYDELYNRLIHITGIDSLRNQSVPNPEEIMQKWWTLDGHYEMIDCEISPKKGGTLC